MNLILLGDGILSSVNGHLATDVQIDGSKYSIWAKKMVTADANWGKYAPDMRGRFARGLNKFDVAEPNTVNTHTANDENKKSGEYQEDQVGPHNHHVYSLGATHPVAPYENGLLGGNDTMSGTNTKETSLNFPLSNETRPKNISVYFYMRIN